jgi:hypothetical protein
LCTVGIVSVVQVIAVVIGTIRAECSIVTGIDSKGFITVSRNVLTDRGKGGWILIVVAAATGCGTGHSVMLAEACSNLTVA